MARKIRVEYPGAVYHVMSRGDHKEEIFRDRQDRLLFLKTLGDACEKTGWWVHAYVLMNNHYHLLLETPQGNLVTGMKWLQGTYTSRFNSRHKVSGHLFQGRYKALIVDGEGDNYFSVLATYIHLNPVRAGLIVPGKALLEQYEWSSYPHYIGSPGARPKWLKMDRVSGGLGIVGTERTLRRGYRAYLESRVLECGDTSLRGEMEAEWKRIRRGWYLGQAPFREMLLGMVAEKLSTTRKGSVDGAAVKERVELDGRLLLNRGLKELKREPAFLEKSPKGCPEKLVLAWWLRRHTTLSRAWVCERLFMGDESRVTQAVREIEGASRGPSAARKKTLEVLWSRIQSE